jgi:hypothetical protein
VLDASPRGLVLLCLSEGQLPDFPLNEGKKEKMQSIAQGITQLLMQRTGQVGGECSDSRIGYRHLIVKTQVTQSNSKSLWTIFLQISEMIDMVKLTIVPGLLSSHLTMTSKGGVSKERIDYEKPFSNCSN